MPFPKIDPNVQHISWGQLRRLSSDDLGTGKTFVVEQAAVVIHYDVFLQMQDALTAAPPMLPMPGPGVPVGHVGGQDFTVKPPQGGPVPNSPLRGV